MCFRKNQKDVEFYGIFMQYLFRFIQILSEFYLVSIGFNWFHMTSSDNCWVSAGNIWQLLGRMAGHLAARCWDFSERKEKWKKTKKTKKSKKMNWKNRWNRFFRFFRSCCCGKNWVTFETQCPLGNLGSSLGSGFLCPQFPRLGSYLRCPSMIF